MIKAILKDIEALQAQQDSDGDAHPGETQVLTFVCPRWVRFRLWLKRIPGLSFQYFNAEWYGIFRAQK